MAWDAGSVVGHVILDPDQWIKGIKTVDKSGNGLINGLKKVGKVVAGIGVALTGLGIAGVKLASDMEETQNKFDVVFRGVEDRANELRNNLTNNFGVSRLEATKMLSAMQDFLVPMGLVRDEAAELSGKFAMMASDLGSFNNLPTVQVLADIQSGIAGQSEPMRKYGTDISETTLKNMALARGIELVDGKLDRSTRTMLIYEKILLDNKDAMGDFERSSMSFANQLKILNARVMDLGVDFGSLLLPVATELIGVAQDLVKALAENDDLIKTLADTLASIVKVATPLIIKVFELIDALAPLLEIIFKVVEGIITALSPVLDDLIDFFAILAEQITPVVDVIGKGLIQVLNALAPTLSLILETFSELAVKILPKLIPILDKMFQIWDLGLQIAEPFIQLAMELVTIFADALLPILDALNPILDTIISLMGLFKDIMTALMPIIRIVADIFVAVLKPAIEIVLAPLKLVIGLLEALGIVSTKVEGNVSGLESEFSTLATTQERLNKFAKDYLAYQRTELGMTNAQIKANILEQKTIYERMTAKVREGKLGSSWMATISQELTKYNSRLIEVNKAIDNQNNALKGLTVTVAQVNEEIGTGAEVAAGKSGAAADEVKKSWYDTFQDVITNFQLVSAEFEMGTMEWQGAWVDMLEVFKEGMQDFFTNFQAVFTGITDIVNQSILNQMTALDNKYKKDKERIENSVMDEEEKTVAFEALDKDYNDKKAALQKAAFKVQKTANIVQAIMNTATAVTGALGVMPPWVGIALAITVGALGAAKIALIANQPIPEFAKGGIASPGLAIVGEQGPEAIDIGRTSRIYNAEDTKNMTRGNVNFNMTFTGPVNSEVDIIRAMQLAGAKYKAQMRGVA